MLIAGHGAADPKVGAGHSVDEWLGDWVLLGTTYHPHQFNGSAGKMLAVSADGMVHGSYTGGGFGSPLRRVKAWCVDPSDMSPSGPGEPLSQHTGYTTHAVTGPNPGNGLPANSGVVAFHCSTPGGSWIGTDFFGCSMAFNLVHHSNGLLLWPHVAVDGNDRIHVVSSGALQSEQSHIPFYNSLGNRFSFDLPDFLRLTDRCEVLGAIPIANPHTSRAAVAFFQRTGQQDVSDQDSLLGRLHNDLLVYSAADGNLGASIQASLPLNLTHFNSAGGSGFGADQPGNPRSEVPFGPWGYRAYSQVDGLFDRTARQALHLVYTSVPVFNDTLIVTGRAGRVETMPCVDFSEDRGLIWHLDADSRQWSVVAGSNCGITDGDFLAPRRDGFRMRTDSPQLAIDASSGYLYTLWSHGSAEDVSANGYANREILARCSADNGLSWGPAVNLSQTASPGCEDGDCWSEDMFSLATEAQDGFLHIQFVRDRHPGWDYTLPPEPVYPPCEIVYQKVPVDLVPPHTGEPWNAAGRVGLMHASRTVIHGCADWAGETAWLDSAAWVEPLQIFNEGPETVVVESIQFLHHSQDPVAVPGQAGLLELGLEVLAHGRWMPVSDWDRRLPGWRGTRFRVRVTYDGLPTHDQLLVFRLVGQPDLVYRIAYTSDEPGCPAVLPLDPALEDEYDSLDPLLVSVDPAPAPRVFTLEANWPNPFNPATTLAFSLQHAGPARLTVHSLLGETVATLVDGPVAAGRHEIAFDASGLASGVYLYTLEAGGRRESRKLVVLK
jgi:hypothetical protein